MSLIDRTKNSLKNMGSRAGEKWQGFKDYTNEKTLSFGDWRDEKINTTKERAGDVYQRVRNRYKVRKYQGKTKLKRKWDRQWSSYANYLVWSFTPYVAAYGTAVNFMASQFGLLSFSLGHLAACGLATYFVKEEFTEWINGIEWVHKDSSSEV